MFHYTTATSCEHGNGGSKNMLHSSLAEISDYLDPSRISQLHKILLLHWQRATSWHQSIGNSNCINISHVHITCSLAWSGHLDQTSSNNNHNNHIPYYSVFHVEGNDIPYGANVWQGKILTNQSFLVKIFPINILHFNKIF